MNTNNSSRFSQLAMDETKLYTKDLLHSQHQQQQKEQQDYVFVLNPHDVILGRGPPSFNFEGNFRFLKVVDSRRDEYRSTESTQIKNQVAKEIMEAIHNNNGRFVRQVKVPSELAGLNNGRSGNDDNDSTSSKVYKIVSEADAMEKIKHTLRGSRTSVNKPVYASSTWKKDAAKTSGKKIKASPTPSSDGSLSSENARKLCAGSGSSSNSAGDGNNPYDYGSKSVKTEGHDLSHPIYLQLAKQENQLLRAQIAKKDSYIQTLELLCARFQQQQRQQQQIDMLIDAHQGYARTKNDDPLLGSGLTTQHQQNYLGQNLESIFLQR